jgi:hypothetical protein
MTRMLSIREVVVEVTTGLGGARTGNRCVHRRGLHCILKQSIMIARLSTCRYSVPLREKFSESNNALLHI